MSYKNTFQLPKCLSKNNIALIFFALMLLGLLCSRSIASISVFLFGVNALRDVPLRRWFREKWWMFGLVWIAFYALSWFWSANKGEWGAHFQVKLPFIFLPLAFSFLDPWTPRQLRVFMGIFIAFMMAGALYSISFIVRDPYGFIAGYQYSHTLPTPAYNDHIAFSSVIAICIAWCFYSWSYWQAARAKMLIGICCIVLIIYLHLLAAKSGLLAFYVFLVCYVIYLLIVNWKKGLLLVFIGGFGVIATYTLIPTLKHRIDYTVYSFSQYKEGDRTGNYSDVGRILSFKIATKIITDNLFLGVGAGDVLDEMGKHYQKDYPQVKKEQYLFPHNQFLTTAVSVGLPATLCLVLWLLAPLKRLKRNRDGFFFVAIWLMLMVPLFVDPFLEVQAGVFVYLFFFLMQRSVIGSSLQSGRSVLA